MSKFNQIMVSKWLESSNKSVGHEKMTYFDKENLHFHVKIQHFKVPVLLPLKYRFSVLTSIPESLIPIIGNVGFLKTLTMWRIQRWYWNAGKTRKVSLEIYFVKAFICNCNQHQLINTIHGIFTKFVRTYIWCAQWGKTRNSLSLKEISWNEHI